jgi:AcrR family transcriptional regulator
VNAQAPPPSRRTPAQARSKRRFEAILDAAAIEFDENGFDAATTEAIAARASTSIGSVYTFFPNKLAIFEALAERCLARSRAAYDLLFTEARMKQSWTRLLDAAIDGFAAFQTDPSFRAVWRNMQLYGVYAKADAELHRGFVARTEASIAQKAPRLPRDRRRLVATMIVEAISALLFMASRHDPEFGRAMIEETKRMIRGYAAPYVREGAGPGRRARRLAG